jgi:putative nucleotidyltransferase with HDIG domain
MAHKLMIVDDEMANLRLLERLFFSDFECLTASSGAEAMQLLQQHDVAVLITDQRMPQMTGIELLKQTAQLRPHMVRILLTGYTDVEALVEAINSGLVYMYVTKPWNNSDLKVKIDRALDYYQNNRKRHALELANERLNSRLEEMKLGAASALAQALRAKDEHEYCHAARVSAYAQAMGRSLGLTKEEQREVSSAALMHNIGLIGTPDQILLDRPQLTERDFKEHSERGAAIVNKIGELQDVADMVRFHQENFDGSGYPENLRGEQIPIGCRIIRVADEFDLLTQPRDPSMTMNHEAALKSMRGRAGKEFDPRLIDTLGRLVETIFTYQGIEDHRALAGSAAVLI